MTRSIVEQAHDMYDAVPYEVPVPDESLYSLLDDAARLYPDRIALDYFGATTTYTQVRDHVLKAARVLREAGVGPGDTVAIALPNCPQAFIAFYACMRIGAIAAQHNPLAPASEIAGQLRRHGGKVAIVWEKCVDTTRRQGGNRVGKVRGYLSAQRSRHRVHGGYFARHAGLAASAPEPSGCSSTRDPQSAARLGPFGHAVVGPRHGLVGAH